MCSVVRRCIELSAPPCLRLCWGDCWVWPSVPLGSPSSPLSRLLSLVRNFFLHDGARLNFPPSPWKKWEYLVSNNRHSCAYEVPYQQNHNKQLIIKKSNCYKKNHDYWSIHYKNRTRILRIKIFLKVLVYKINCNNSNKIAYIHFYNKHLSYSIVIVSQSVIEIISLVSSQSFQSL